MMSFMLTAAPKKAWAAMCGSSLLFCSVVHADSEYGHSPNKVDESRKIEEVVVIGEFIGLEVPEVGGRFHLDKTFLEIMPQSGGDLTDLLSLLPGVQSANSALSTESLVDVKAQPISISSAQPWQTGFFLDGMNYNSRQDPGSYQRSVNAVNDIQGQPQAINLNLALVEAVDVFDNNIPVQYGSFSGGVVDAKSRSAAYGEKYLTVEWRGTRSDWGEFNLIEGDEPDSEQADEFSESLASQIPVFDKDSFTLQSRFALTKFQGIAIDLNQVKSVISDVNLNQRVLTERKNQNARVKYSIEEGWFDELHLSGFWAPYENINFRKNTLNSAFTIEGGGQGVYLNTEKDFSDVSWASSLSYLKSRNNRQAPSRFYIWNQANGTGWGKYASGNASDSPVSLEGGYGNLEKIQTTFSWESNLNGKTDLFGLMHNWMMGIEVDNETLQRQRHTSAYVFNSAVQYSTDIGGAQLNCNGFTLDCKELDYRLPLSELEAQLGAPLDFSNIDHVLAYSDNIAVTPQYFQSRRVYPKENIEVSVNKLSLYMSDDFDWRRLNAYIGLRYDWDDFFQNHNLAPRMQLGWDMLGNGSLMTVLGANRYYDAGLLTYKVKELEEPFYTQYRRVTDSVLQGWQLSSADSDYRTGYKEVKTPYDDEMVLGWKHSTSSFGIYSVRYVKRWKRDQLARMGESVLEADGYRYAYQDNSGSGESERISVSWSKRWKRQSFWLNASHTESIKTVSSYDTRVEDVPADELVYYDGHLITSAQLDSLDSDFSKPVIANLGWTGSWFDGFTTSISGTYKGAYDTAERSGFYNIGDVVWTCPECQSDTVSVQQYRKNHYPETLMLNLSTHFDVKVSRLASLKISFDVLNLLNERTYTVRESESGVEVGRQLWLGASVNF